MIYSRIKQLCKERKVSINQLEIELEISKGSLCKIDKNKPSSDKLAKIASYFGVTTDYLLTGKEKNDLFTVENAHLLAQIIKDTELTKALNVYFGLSDAEKNHIINTINLMKKGK